MKKLVKRGRTTYVNNPSNETNDIPAAALVNLEIEENNRTSVSKPPVSNHDITSVHPDIVDIDVSLYVQRQKNVTCIFSRK